MQTIERYRSTVTDCYKDGLKHDDPGLKGKLVIRFTIDVRGSVPSAHVSFVDANVAECVERVVKANWVFAPNADSEGPFEINFMLTPS